MSAYSFDIGLSSKYVSNLSVSTDTGNINESSGIHSIKYDTNIDAVSKECTRRLRENSSASFLVRWYDSTTCRESLLYYMERFLEPYLRSSLNMEYMMPPIIYTKYLGDGGNSLDKTKVELIEKFADIFMKDNQNYSIKVYNNIAVLGWKCRTNLSTQLYTISLILWILRNNNIMHSVVDKFYGKVLRIKDLLEYLSVEFLKNHSWGDPYNSNLGLSIFSYGIFKGKLFHKMGLQSGPVNAVCGLDLSFIVDYIKDIYLPVSPQIDTLNTHYVGSGFLSGFKDLVEEFSKNTKKEQEFAPVAKKPRPINDELDSLEIWNSTTG